MSERAHLSIGEVLNLLQDEFPDVTISKIRFLESQGLLDPERTPSGYRKFYDDDIARLRWILQQQREHFLPLKVIKDRLADDAAVEDEPGGVDYAGNGTGWDPDVDPDVGLDVDPDDPDDPDITLHGVPAPVSSLPDFPDPSDALFTAGATAVSLSVDELARATGLTARQIGELERFGLIESEQYGSASRYDEDALLIARVAATMLREGVEVRHLRMFKLAAEREAAFYEQLVLPIMKQRSPKARQEALETLRVLAAGGDSLRTAMLRGSLKHLVNRG